MALTGNELFVTSVIFFKGGHKEYGWKSKMV